MKILLLLLTAVHLRLIMVQGKRLSECVSTIMCCIISKRIEHFIVIIETMEKILCKYYHSQTTVATYILSI